jgi:hypothetical protein
MFVSSGLGATSGTPAQSKTYFQGYGYDSGYYVGGPPSQFTFPYFPFMAVIDLNTGTLMDKDYNTGDTDYLTPSEIIAMVQEANGG